MIVTPESSHAQCKAEVKETQGAEFSSDQVRRKHLRDLLFSAKPGSIQMIPELLESIKFTYDHGVNAVSPAGTSNMLRGDLVELQIELIRQSDDLSSVAAAQANCIKLFQRYITLDSLITSDSPEAEIELICEIAKVLSELLRQVRYRVIEEEEEGIMIMPGFFPTKNGV